METTTPRTVPAPHPAVVLLAIVALFAGLVTAAVLLVQPHASASGRPVAAPSPVCTAAASPFNGYQVCSPGPPPPPTSYNLAYGGDMWFNYTNPCPSNPNCGYRWGQFYSDGNGNAQLSGLVRTINPLGRGTCTEIVKLNAAYGPDQRIALPALASSGLGSVDVLPTGSVVYCARYAALPSGGWVSLDGVAWRIQGVAR